MAQPVPLPGTPLTPVDSSFDATISAEPPRSFSNLVVSALRAARSSLALLIALLLPGVVMALVLSQPGDRCTSPNAGSGADAPGDTRSRRTGGGPARPAADPLGRVGPAATPPVALHPRRSMMLTPCVYPSPMPGRHDAPGDLFSRHGQLSGGPHRPTKGRFSPP